MSLEFDPWNKGERKFSFSQPFEIARKRERIWQLRRPISPPVFLRGRPGVGLFGPALEGFRGFRNRSAPHPPNPSPQEMGRGNAVGFSIRQPNVILGQRGLRGLRAEEIFQLGGLHLLIEAARFRESDAASASSTMRTAPPSRRARAPSRGRRPNPRWSRSRIARSAPARGRRRRSPRD